MIDPKNIVFTDNSALAERADHYASICVDAGKIVKSWRHSLFSFEWLYPEGGIKTAADLPEGERAKRADIEEKLAAGDPLEKPVLGIGMMDNVEIGIGRAAFLTLAAHGVERIPVHVPKSNESDFKEFLAGVK